MVKKSRKTNSRRQKSWLKSCSPALRVACSDLIVTALWMFISSLFGEVASFLSPLTGLSEFSLGTFISLLILGMFMNLCGYVGGAIFNPVLNLSLVVSKKGSLREHSLRIVFQLVGTFVGIFTAFSLVPKAFQSKFPFLSGGLKDGVSLETGLLCETVLGFFMCAVFLASMDAKDKIFAFWAPLLASIGYGLVGLHYTGPSLNPFASLSWNAIFQTHSWREHLLVFWGGPLAGAVLAGVTYRPLSRFRTSVCLALGASGKQAQRSRGKPHVTLPPPQPQLKPMESRQRQEEEPTARTRPLRKDATANGVAAPLVSGKNRGKAVKKLD